MRDAAASIRMQVQADSSMLTTHASLATELQQAEALAKVWSAVRHPLKSHCHLSCINFVFRPKEDC